MKKQHHLLLVFGFLVLSCHSLLAQKFEWKHRIASNRESYAKSTAIDKLNNIITGGTFIQSAYMDAPTFNVQLQGSSGGPTPYLRKVSSNGSFQWAVRFPCLRNAYLDKVSVDNYGNIYALGSFDSTISFGGTFDHTPSGGNAMYLVKFDSFGKLLWERVFSNIGKSSLMYPSDMDVDSTGQVYITGRFKGTSNFKPVQLGGSYNLVTASNTWDIFALALNNSGGFRWVKQHKFVGYPSSISVYKPNEKIAIAGNFLDTLKIQDGMGQVQLVSNGQTDGFVMVYRDNASLEFATRFGGTSTEDVREVKFDKAGNILCAGSFTNTMQAGNLSFTSKGSRDVFFLKLDGAGNHVFAKQIGSKKSELCYAIFNDERNNIYVGGAFVDTLDFDPSPNVNNKVSVNRTALYIAKYGPTGDYKWAGVINSYGGDNNYSDLAVSPNGEMIVGCGNVNGITDFDPGTGVNNLTPQGSDDGFVFKWVTPNSDAYFKDTSCGAYVSPSEKYIWNVSNVYKDTIVNQVGGDSFMLIDLIVNNVNTGVTAKVGTVEADAQNAQYQWLNCTNNYAPIIGETNAVFTPVNSGSYAVEVTQNGCTDTSICYQVFPASVYEKNGFKMVEILPNPTHDRIRIKTSSGARVSIMDMRGAILQNMECSGELTIDVSEFKAGMYFVYCLFKDGTVYGQKILKE